MFGSFILKLLFKIYATMIFSNFLLNKKLLRTPYLRKTKVPCFFKTCIIHVEKHVAVVDNSIKIQ